jgi:hypothetical protein
MAQVLGTLGCPLDLQIRQGMDVENTLTLTNPDGTPLDLTGCTLTAKMRRTPTSTAVVFDTAITDAANGVARLDLTAEQTADLAPPAWSWDLKLTDAAGKVRPLAYGHVVVVLEVAHE